MTKELEILNNELSELKRILIEFTEATDEKIKDLSDRIDQLHEKMCDEELQDVVDKATSLIFYGDHSGSEVFDLFLSLIDTYGLDRCTTEELYMKTDEYDNEDSYDSLEIFKNDPTELNFINFLKHYCWNFDFSFTKQLNNVFNYKNATSIISELESLGFRKCQFKLIYKRDIYTDSRDLSEEFCYSDLLMITDISEYQEKILIKQTKITDIFFVQHKPNTCFIQI